MRGVVTSGWVLLALGVHAPQTAFPQTVSIEPGGQACRVACRAEIVPSSPGLGQCISHCMSGKSLTREGPGQARPAGSVATSTNSMIATSPITAISTGAPPITFGAVYLATPPNTAHGMVVGQPDRLTAHRQAEAACRAGGASCVMARDFTLPCAAIVEGVRRAPGAFIMTSDPSTFRVRSVTFGVASNPADAQREARDACAQRDNGALTCRIVQAQCGPR